MEYKVIPFDPVNSRTDSSADAANQLQQLITSMVTDGWKYLRLEAISATMPGTSGCFGIGAQPPSSVDILEVLLMETGTDAEVGPILPNSPITFEELLALLFRVGAKRSRRLDFRPQFFELFLFAGQDFASLLSKYVEMLTVGKAAKAPCLMPELGQRTVRVAVEVEEHKVRFKGCACDHLYRSMINKEDRRNAVALDCCAGRHCLH